MSRVQSTTGFPVSSYHSVVRWPKPVPNSAGLVSFAAERPAEFLAGPFGAWTFGSSQGDVFVDKSERPRVFVSHTSELAKWPEDRSCIAAVLDAVRQAGLVARDMRDFTAATQSPAMSDIEELKQCGIYVGVLGFKFGTPMRENPEISYTRQEFEYARSEGYSLLVFLLHEEADGPGKLFIDTENGAKQQAFRAEVQNSGGVGLTCQFFKTADELHRLVYQALLRELERRQAGNGEGDGGGGETGARDVAARERVLERLAAARVGEWVQARRGDRQDRLEHYVAPHYSVLREGLQPARLKAGGGPSAAGEAELGTADADRYEPVAQEGDSPEDELERLLTGRRRLCISEDAGAGKSVLTRRVLSFACTEAGQRAVFGGRPGLVLRFEQWEQDWPRDLRAAVEKEVQRGCVEAESGVDARAMTDWLFSEGRVLLLLDGLDQVQNDAAIAAVSEFLTGAGRDCRAIVTGRPYRIDQSRGNLLRSAEWQFARIEGFDDEQVAEYLRGFAIDQIFPDRAAVRDLLRIPSVLRIVRELLELPESAGKVLTFRSRGELYSRACSRLVLDAGKKTDVNFDRRRGRKLEEVLASIAFSMMVSRMYDAAARGESQVNSIERSAERRRQGGVSEEEWRQVQQISRLTNHCILEGTREEMLSWQHRGMMEYYCGLHLACYAREDCLRQAAEFAGEPQWSWAWRFAIELPGEVAEESVRTQALELLFRRPERQRRPTELMYRGWSVLEQSAGGRLVLSEFRGEYVRLRSEVLALQALEASFVRCPPEPTAGASRFRMGSLEDDSSAYRNEKPAIQVAVQSFELLRDPVTVAQFGAFDGVYERAESETLQKYAPVSDCPAIRISWYDAWCFAAWCGSRLPREYEWEFACRAGTETRYWWGDQMNSDRCTFRQGQTTPASDAHANPWGLRDLLGNVWEWCEDWYSKGLSETVSQGFEGTSRVLRGGSFYNYSPDYLRCANRDYYSPDYRNFILGFRISRTK